MYGSASQPAATTAVRVVLPHSLISAAKAQAERFYTRWVSQCEHICMSWEPDADDFAFELGVLWDDEDPLQNTALLSVFEDEFNSHLDNNSFPIRRPNQAFRVTEY